MMHGRRPCRDRTREGQFPPGNPDRKRATIESEVKFRLRYGDEDTR